MKFIIIIPARFQSSRLPGKPLMKINGVPMIERTYLKCLKVTTKNKVYVATDDLRIRNFCTSKKIPVIMTSKKCLTGTDRIAEVAKKVRADVYINVQGDEPIFNPKDLRKLIIFAKRNPQTVINGYTKINSKQMFNSGHIPKVVFRKDGRLLYMSRANIPTTKKKDFLTSFRQVCLYSLPRKSLSIFSKIKRKTPLEKIEDCELLRFLELGLEIKMIKMTNKSVSVDTKKDLRLVSKILSRK